MSTVHQISTELSNLISQTKRRNNELRQAAENSHNILKKYTPNTDEASFLKGLSQYYDFISPFLIACSTRNAKYSATAVQCLHTLINFEGLPSTRLVEVLEALKEATHLGVEIHLKILQSLPSLIQNYGDHLSNNLIVELLLICYILQGGNKVPVVVNTALATLQQLIISVFDKVAKEDSSLTPLPKTFEVPIENNDKILVSPAAYDALRVFFDICSLIERQKPVFLKFGHLPETVSLELIESILTSHSEIFSTHVEFRYVIRTRAVPLLLRAFSEKSDFPVTVRVTRILYLIIRRLLPVLNVECEVILSMLTHMLDEEAGPYWKRVLCMEVFQGVSLEFSLIENIYSEFDAKDGRRPVIKGWTAALEKLSAEKPAIIGLGTSSTPMDIPDLSRQNNGAADSSPAVTALELSQMVGLSSKTSLVRSSCIDLLDKTEPPNLPPSYLYYMALSCINSISEGIARAVLSATSENAQTTRKRHQKHSTIPRIPSQVDLTHDISKLRSRSSSPKRTNSNGASKRTKTEPPSEQLALVSSLLDSIWPELLSSFNTFFRATMDSEMYHTLVRSAQKFAHASGVLLLFQPRDAYLTLLGQFSITFPEPEEKHHSLTRHGLLSMEGLVGSLSPTMTRESSRSSTFSNGQQTSLNSSTTATSTSRPKMTSRNILSFRALLNLGIALGPTLGSGWNVILETLQYADFLVYGGSLSDRRRGSSSSKYEYNIESAPLPFSGLGTDFVTVENSVRRLLESTKDYPAFAFNDFVSSIAGVSWRVLGLPVDPENKYQRLIGIGNAAECDSNFLLDFLGAVVHRNSVRFVSSEPNDVQSWTIISQFLVSVETSRNVAPSPRIRASQVHNEAIRQNSLEYLALEKSEGTADPRVAAAQLIIFESLLEKVKRIVSLKLPSDGSISICSTEAKIHVAGIDYLNKLLFNCGGSLTKAWDIVFDIIDTVFNWLSSEVPLEGDSQNKRYLVDRSIQLLKSGFESLQLICNDFLELLPANCVIRLIDTLYNFCHQEGDLNISFTSLSFFWIISDYLRKTLGDTSSQQDLQTEISTKKELAELSAIGSIHNHDCVNAIWMISLLRLASISYDPRPQVRNGAIQILFRIFDATGLQLPPRVWRACQSIVLETVMENNPFKAPGKTLTADEITQWEETMTLIITSIGNIYSTFLHLFVQDSERFEVLWKRILGYFQEFSATGEHLPVTNSIYKSFNSILGGFIKSHISMSTASLDDTWDFWTTQAIVESKANASAAQDCYKSFAEVFANLKRLTGKEQLSDERITRTIQQLKACLTYPLLAPFYSDKDNLSPLQSEALYQLQLIDLDTNLHTARLILLLYADLIVQAFQLEEAPVHSNKDARNSTFKRPTFVALSQHCLEILQGSITKAAPYYDSLIRQGTIRRLTESLYTVIQAKLRAPFLSAAASSKKGKVRQLWELADLRVLEIVKGSLPFVVNVEEDADGEVAQLWTWYAKSTIAVISPGGQTLDTITPAAALEYEDFDRGIYDALMALFLDPGAGGVAPLAFWSTLLQALFKYSLIYNVPRLAPVLDSFSDASGDCAAVAAAAAVQVQWLLGNTFFGSTEALTFKPRQNLAFTCLNDLARAAAPATGENVEAQPPLQVRDLANRFLTLRLSMVLYLYIADHPLRGRAPMPKVQRRELLHVLDLAATTTTTTASGECSIVTLYPLFVRAVPIAEKDTAVLALLQTLLLKIGRAHSIVN